MKDLDDIAEYTIRAQNRLKARLEAIRLTKYFIEQMQIHGYPADCAVEGGRITLRVDLGAEGTNCRAPAPQVEYAGGLESVVVKLPAPPKPAPAPVAEKSGPLTDAERDRIVEMTVAGRTVKEIAADLGRNTASIGRARGYLQERIEDARDLAKLEKAEAPEPKPEPAPQPAPAPAPASPPTVSLDIPKSARERVIQAHLNALGYLGQWSAHRDLDLVETICRDGSKSLGTKPIGGIMFSRDECLSRWRALNEQPGDLEHQAALLKVLRAIAAADADPVS